MVDIHGMGFRMEKILVWVENTWISIIFTRFELNIVIKR